MSARDDLKHVARSYARALRRQGEARAALDAVIQRAVAEGMSEVEAARWSGLDRMTVRRVLGKR